MSIATITTAEELLQAGDIGRCELVRGELNMMSPAGANHGIIVGRLHVLLGQFVKDHDLGEVLGAETGFTISRNPDTVRAPDIAFVRRDRLGLVPKRGFFPGAPDLAVEVLSPSDTASEVLAKVRDWLSAGCGSVWIVDPEQKTISIHRRNQPVMSVAEPQPLTDEPVLVGLRLALSEVFS